MRLLSVDNDSVDRMVHAAIILPRSTVVLTFSYWSSRWVKKESEEDIERFHAFKQEHVLALTLLSNRNFAVVDTQHLIQHMTSLSTVSMTIPHCHDCFRRTTCSIFVSSVYGSKSGTFTHVWLGVCHYGIEYDHYWNELRRCVVSLNYAI